MLFNRYFLGSVLKIEAEKVTDEPNDDVDKFTKV